MKTRHYIIIVCLIVITSATLWYFHRHSKKGFKHRLVRLANEELKRWQGFSETSPLVADTLLKYWQSVGKTFSPADMQSTSVQNTYPWSSAFISYLFKKTGAKDKFPYSSSHSTYFQIAKANRNNPKASLIGYRINEYAPKVGDIIVLSRENGKGYDSDGYFPSHGELVVKTGKGYIETIGGNVGNKVALSTFKTDQNGMLTKTGKPVFMVIKNNIKG